MLIRSVLRAPEGEAGAGGGGNGGGSDDAGASELAKLKAENAEFKRKESEASAKAKKAEAEAAKASGEVSKLVEHFEKQLAERDAAIAGLTGERDGLLKGTRAKDLAEKVATRLGVSVSPRLLGLLPQTGEDVAPEKLTDALVGRVAESVLKLDPDLKNAGKAGAAAGTAADSVSKDDPNYWRNVGRQLSGR
jgi:hypothetical protein